MLLAILSDTKSFLLTFKIMLNEILFILKRLDSKGVDILKLI